MAYLLPAVASGIAACIAFILGLSPAVCLLAALIAFPAVHLLLLDKQNKNKSISGGKTFFDEEEEREQKKEAKRQKRIEEAKRKAAAKLNAVVEKTEKSVKDTANKVTAAVPVAAESDDDSDDEDSKKLSKSAAKKAKKKKAEQERKAKEEEERKRQEEEKKKEEAKKKKAAKKAAKTGNNVSVASPESTVSTFTETKRSPVSEDDGWQSVRSEKSSSHKKAAAATAAAAANADANKKGNKSTAVGYVPETVEEMFIPFKYHPLIIGKDAATLKLLQAGTGARVDVPKKDSGSTKVQIIGEPAQVASCKAAINCLINHGYSSITHPGTVHDDIHVESKNFGLVIGPKGAYLQAIQNKTNTRINFPDKDSKSERVTIIGKKDDVRAARLAIKELIADGYSPLTHEGLIRKEIDFPHDKLHVLVGPKGQTIKSIQGNSGTKINIPDRNTSSGVTIVGTAEGVAHAEKQINKLLTPPTLVEEAPEEEYVNGTWAHSQTNEDDLW